MSIYKSSFVRAPKVEVPRKLWREQRSNDETYSDLKAGGVDTAKIEVEVLLTEGSSVVHAINHGSCAALDGEAVKKTLREVFEGPLSLHEKCSGGIKISRRLYLWEFFSVYEALRAVDKAARAVLEAISVGNVTARLLWEYDEAVHDALSGSSAHSKLSLPRAASKHCRSLLDSFRELNAATLDERTEAEMVRYAQNPPTWFYGRKEDQVPKLPAYDAEPVDVWGKWTLVHGYAMSVEIDEVAKMLINPAAAQRLGYKDIRPIHWILFKHYSGRSSGVLLLPGPREDWTESLAGSPFRSATIRKRPSKDALETVNVLALDNPPTRDTELAELARVARALEA